MLYKATYHISDWHKFILHQLKAKKHDISVCIFLSKINGQLLCDTFWSVENSSLSPIYHCASSRIQRPWLATSSLGRLDTNSRRALGLWTTYSTTSSNCLIPVYSKVEGNLIISQFWVKKQQSAKIEGGPYFWGSSFAESLQVMAFPVWRWQIWPGSPLHTVPCFPAQETAPSQMSCLTRPLKLNI